VSRERVWRGALRGAVRGGIECEWREGEQLLTIYAMVTVRRTTTLPIGADEAFALALKPATFAYVARGVMRVPALERLGASFDAVPGAQVHGRVWWLGVLPTWTHHLRVVAIQDADHAIQTAERGGPIRTWNHRLTFTPAANGVPGCEYTDEILIDAGRLTRPTALFARAFFALRQARWRRLAAVLAA
jgi:hypothetical protein